MEPQATEAKDADMKTISAVYRTLEEADAVRAELATLDPQRLEIHSGPDVAT